MSDSLDCYVRTPVLTELLGVDEATVWKMVVYHHIPRPVGAEHLPTGAWFEDLWHLPEVTQHMARKLLALKWEELDCWED